MLSAVFDFELFTECIIGKYSMFDAWEEAVGGDMQKTFDPVMLTMLLREHGITPCTVCGAYKRTNKSCNICNRKER